MTLCIRKTVLALLLATITASHAKSLIVVQDNGGASALPYYDALGLTAESPSRSTVNPPTLQPVDESFALPVKSELLTPGTVRARPLNAPGMLPFFMVGDDELSRRWLKANYPKLASINAVGLVVAVETPEGLKALRELIPNLLLSPVSGDDIARRLVLRHYPVLITASGIEQ